MARNKATAPQQPSIGDLYLKLAVVLTDILRHPRTPDRLTQAVATFIDTAMTLPEGNLAVSAAQLNYWLVQLQNEEDARTRESEQTRYLEKQTGFRITPV